MFTPPPLGEQAFHFSVEATLKQMSTSQCQLQDCHRRPPFQLDELCSLCGSALLRTIFFVFGRCTATGFPGPRTSLAHGFLWPIGFLFCAPGFPGPGHEVFLGVLAVLIRIQGCCDFVLPVYFYLAWTILNPA